MAHRTLVALTLLSLLSAQIIAHEPSAERASLAGEFQSFWTEFRASALAGKMDKVIAMTRFPFKTRGIFDEDPVLKHSKTTFPKVWTRLLNEFSGLSTTYLQTQREYIERREKVGEEDLIGPQKARVANLVFEKVRGKWLFAFAYINEE